MRLATLLVLLPIFSACGGDHGAGRDARAKRVILIVCDTLRADRLGTYGYDRSTTPNLDDFARSAIVFEEAYSTAPMTQPSMSSLMSGRLPEHVGVIGGNLRRLPSEVETMAERLAGRGVATGAVISNWVLRRPEKKEGDVGVQQGFQHFDDRMEQKELNRRAFERLAPATTDDAIAWLQTMTPDQALFLWVHYQDPHGPYTPPEPLARKFATAADDGEKVRIGKNVLGNGQIPSYQAIGRERRPQVYRDLYDAEIRYFDRELGRFLKWLQENGFYDDSLIVFTSDHGESLGEHDYWFCHGENVHREVVRVPLIVRLPYGARAGRSDRVASHLDVWPTVMQAMDLPAGNVYGHSMFDPLPEDRVVGQSLYPPGEREKWWSVSDGRWRVVWREETGERRLFDIVADPYEEHDLAAQHPQRVKSMVATWTSYLESGNASAAALGTEMDASHEALQALGYVDVEPDEDEAEEQDD